MDISVNYQKASSKNEAYELALAEITPEYVAKYGVTAEVEKDATNCRLQASGKGFTLKLQFTDSACEVSLELSFLLKPFRGKILEGIEKKLQRTV